MTMTIFPWIEGFHFSDACEADEADMLARAMRTTAANDWALGATAPHADISVHPMGKADAKVPASATEYWIG